MRPAHQGEPLCVDVRPFGQPFDRSGDIVGAVLRKDGAVMDGADLAHSASGEAIREEYRIAGTDQAIGPVSFAFGEVVLLIQEATAAVQSDDSREGSRALRTQQLRGEGALAGERRGDRHFLGLPGTGRPRLEDSYRSDRSQ